jgi:2'-5' RNA ligase
MAEAMRFEPLLFNVGRFVLYSARESIGGGRYIVEQAYELAA